jgi:hypothetical protein
MPKRSGQPLTTPSGRPASFGQRVRERIDISSTINRLQRVALGEEEMTMVEFQAAKFLVNKRIPDLKPLEPPQNTDQNAKSITNDELFKVIEGQATRIESK